MSAAWRRRLDAALSGRYTIERELGRGGMATVYLARDLRHGRRVAVKVLHPELSASLGAERFAREIELTAGLQHPHILALHDSGTFELPEGGTGLYYVMPFVAGESLRARLARDRQLPLEEALALAREMAEALAEAHARGVVHRDVKPENVLLSGGHALVSDFGIARAVDSAEHQRLTSTGLSLGTPAYMSPEQATGDRQVDGRSDQYSLACVVYEMLAGEPPYTGPTPQAIVAKRFHAPRPDVRHSRPQVPAAVAEALTRALSLTPADRFASMQAFAAALWKAPAHEGRTGELPGVRVPLRRVAPLLGAAALVVAGTLLLRSRAAPPAPGDPGVVAVFPFRVSGAAPALAYLGEGMVELLAIRLAGASPHAVDPRATLSAWRRAAGDSAAGDPAAAIARRLGAGRLLDGAVVGTPAHVSITAVLRRTAGGDVATASVEGPADSAPALVDRLVARLLATEANEGDTRLADLTTLAALRPYLAGRSAYRRGQYALAFREFSQSLAADSNFALAGLGLIRAGLRTSRSAAVDLTPGERAAVRNQSQLAPPDRHALYALVGRRYPAPFTNAEQLADLDSALTLAPDRADAWFEAGDFRLHWGLLSDMADPVEDAQQHFRRALALDSSFAMPLDHLLLAAFYRGDSAAVRRLSPLFRALDGAGDRAGFFAWRIAVALGDSSAAATIRARFDALPDASLEWIAREAELDAVGLGDAERAGRVLVTRAAAAPAHHRAVESLRRLLLNLGRPGAAAALPPATTTDGGLTGTAAAGSVLEALFWEADSAPARAALPVLDAIAGAPVRDSASAAAGAQAACVSGLWRAAVREPTGAGGLADPHARLTSPLLPAQGPFNADDARFCAAIIEAALDPDRRSPAVARLLARADSLILVSAVLNAWTWGDLMEARLLELRGDLAGALRCVRRLPVEVEGLGDAYLSTYHIEHGRLAALAGARDEAARAYGQYLALRSGAEPAGARRVAQVRAALAGLRDSPQSAAGMHPSR